jgi:hypothetical protein
MRGEAGRSHQHSVGAGGHRASCSSAQADLRLSQNLDENGQALMAAGQWVVMAVFEGEPSGRIASKC